MRNINWRSITVLIPLALGQLVVEGGSRSYSDVVGHSNILRPQPVPCIAMPPLCHAVREPGCAYQTFCQPSLCCLHCRPAQTIPLEKFPAQCAQATRRSSPPSLHSCWDAETAVPVHPPGAQPMQQSTSHPGSDLVQHGSSSTQPRHPVGSNIESLPADSGQTVTDGKSSTAGQKASGRGQTSAPEASTGPEASADGELPQIHKQAQVQTTAETSCQPMVELQPIAARIGDDDDRVSFNNVSLFIVTLQGNTFALSVLDTDHSPQAWHFLVFAKVAFQPRC